MKKLIIILSVFLTMFSCTNPSKKALTQSEKETIVSNVDATINQIFTGWNARDINIAFASFLNSPDFTFIGVDGSIGSYTDLINMSKEVFGLWKDAKFSLLEKKVVIVNAELVIVSAIYSGEIVYQDATVEKYTKVGSTFVLNMHEGKWFVTQFQESSLAPEVVKPTKN